MNFDADEWDRSRRRSETLERAQKEREDNIRREIAEKLMRDAQAKLDAEYKRLDEHATTKDREFSAMLAKAERDNQAAVAAERATAAAEANRLKAETAARVHEVARDALAFELARYGVDVFVFERVVELISSGKIPNIRIEY